MISRTKWLRVAFLSGAIADGLALFPIFSPYFSRLMWGSEQFNGLLSKGYGSSLMAGWTILLVWAYREPLERRFIALLTFLGVLGLVVTEIFVVASGAVTILGMAKTWGLQAILLGLFGYGYAATEMDARRRSSLGKLR